jgi:hypothetical protein
MRDDMWRNSAEDPKSEYPENIKTTICEIIVVINLQKKI